jgi:hypothetical protein
MVDEWILRRQSAAAPFRLAALPELLCPICRLRAALTRNPLLRTVLLQFAARQLFRAFLLRSAIGVLLAWMRDLLLLLTGRFLLCLALSLLLLLPGRFLLCLALSLLLLLPHRFLLCLALSLLLLLPHRFLLCLALSLLLLFPRRFLLCLTLSLLLLPHRFLLGLTLSLLLLAHGFLLRLALSFLLLPHGFLLGLTLRFLLLAHRLLLSLALSFLLLAHRLLLGLALGFLLLARRLLLRFPRLLGKTPLLCGWVGFVAVGKTQCRNEYRRDQQNRHDASSWAHKSHLERLLHDSLPLLQLHWLQLFLVRTWRASRLARGLTSRAARMKGV